MIGIERSARRILLPMILPGMAVAHQDSTKTTAVLCLTPGVMWTMNAGNTGISEGRLDYDIRPVNLRSWNEAPASAYVNGTRATWTLGVELERKRNKGWGMTLGFQGYSYTEDRYAYRPEITVDAWFVRIGHHRPLFRSSDSGRIQAFGAWGPVVMYQDRNVHMSPARYPPNPSKDLEIGFMSRSVMTQMMLRMGCVSGRFRVAMTFHANVIGWQDAVWQRKLHPDDQGVHWTSDQGGSRKVTGDILIGDMGIGLTYLLRQSNTVGAP